MLKTFTLREPVEILLRFQAKTLNDPLLEEALDVPGNYGVLSSMEYITPPRLVKDLFLEDAELLIRRGHEELALIGDDEKGKYYSSLKKPRKAGLLNPVIPDGCPYLSLLAKTVVVWIKHFQKESEEAYEYEKARGAGDKVALNRTLNQLQLDNWNDEYGAGKERLYELITKLRNEISPDTERIETSDEIGTVYWLYIYLNKFVNTATIIEKQHFESWLQLWDLYVDLHNSLKDLESKNIMGTMKEASHA